MEDEKRLERIRRKSHLSQSKADKEKLRERGRQEYRRKRESDKLEDLIWYAKVKARVRAKAKYKRMLKQESENVQRESQK